MKLLRKNTLVFLIVLAVAVCTPFVIFICRRPVIIVADTASMLMYGEDRIKRESALTALSLYRPVKTVYITDDADDDIIPYAVIEMSINPYCVLFPLRFIRAARQYHELNPSACIIILEGRFGGNLNPAIDALGDSAQDFYVFKTDVSTDFYNAGLGAGFLCENISIENPGSIAVFYEQNIQRQGREAFLSALNTHENPPETGFYTSFSEFYGGFDLTCAVISGTGAEFFENFPDTPVIMFTWISPDLLPDEVFMVFDDSPWAQTLAAVRMSDDGVKQGLIRSKIIHKNSRKFDINTLRKTYKSL